MEAVDLTGLPVLRCCPSRMNSPTVSVLMPTYNRAKYLHEAIDSVLAQSFADLELIVIDDGSTDGTDTILRSLTDPRVRILRQEHSGLCPSLNAGLSAARGKFIARNDSDDVWLPDLLATLVPVLQDDPEIGFAYARAQEMTGDGTPTPSMRGFPLRDSKDTLASLLYADYTSSITTMFRRATLDRAGLYDTTIDWHSDWDMVLRVALHGEGVFVDRLVARFRTHGGNVTAVHGEMVSRRLQTRLVVLDNLFQRPDLPPQAEALRPVAYRNVHIVNGLQWLSRREYRLALQAFRRAIASGPSAIGTVGRILWSVTSWFGLNKASWSARATYALLKAVRPAPPPTAGTRQNKPFDS
jgi:glycosyltransferase involved in cell wall biosynthesis